MKLIPSFVLFNFFFLIFIVPAKECSSPPIVEYAIPFYIGSSSYEVEKLRRYPIDSKVSYQCKNGYELEGNDILTCSISGCWTPKELPRCRNMEQYYSKYIDNNATMQTETILPKTVI